MSKQQTRRTVSVKLELYATLYKHCCEHSMPMAWLVECAVNDYFNTRGVELVSRNEALAVLNAKRDDARAALRAKHVSEAKAASGIFTF